MPHFEQPGPTWPPKQPGGAAIIGGLPWAQSQTDAPSTPEAAIAASVADSEAATASRSPPGLGERLKAIFDRSPAWSVSLIVHVVALLVLALWVVRQQAHQSRVLTLSFSDAARPARDGIPDAVVIAKSEAAPLTEPDLPAPPPPKAVVREERTNEPTPSPKPAAAVSPTPSPVAGEGRAPIRSQLSGRSMAARAGLLNASGGTEATESAVGLALGWLARNASKQDGLWSLKGPYADGGSQENRLAATAMALLALQGAGNTPSEGPHADVVARAWKTVLRKQRADGTFDLGAIPDLHANYSHAQMTIALTEAFGMTGDPSFEQAARKAVGHALAAQMPDGGWRYELPAPGRENKGDMSVTGWFLMALKTAEMAGLGVPAESYARLEKFLDGVFISEAKGYGYQINPNQKIVDFRAALTAEGLLCRQYLGWARGDPRIVSGAALLLAESPLDFGYRGKNVYAWYYQTQVFHHVGGEVWEAWNGALRETLPAEQVKSGREAGSWDRANDQWGHVGGRLYVTCLCTLMLESYYRHLSIYESPPAPGIPPH